MLQYGAGTPTCRFLGWRLMLKAMLRGKRPEHSIDSAAVSVAGSTAAGPPHQAQTEQHAQGCAQGKATALQLVSLQRLSCKRGSAVRPRSGAPGGC